MHPVNFLGPIAIAYMAFAGFTDRAHWHIAIGAWLMGALNFSRAVLARVGPVKSLVIRSREALHEGFAHMRERSGSTVVALYAALTTVGAAIPAGLIYGAGLLDRRFVGH